MNSNKYELTNKCQQGGVLIAMRDKSVKLITATGSNQTSLGRWNWIQLECNEKNIRMIMAY